MEGCPQLLNLVPKDREWHVSQNDAGHGIPKDNKLELRLGPPGEDQFLSLTNTVENQCPKQSSCGKKYAQKVFSINPWPCGSMPSSVHQRESQKEQQQQPKPSYLQFKSQTLAAMAKEFKQPCSSGLAELQHPDKKACSTPAGASVPATTAVPNSSHKRSAVSPVVGWPPVRSFRKNLASTSSSKPASESTNKTLEASGRKSEISTKFVKINMDGVPIGRKVDLKAYDSYETLAVAVDELFRGLLAAQRDSSAPAGFEDNMEKKAKEITGAIAGSGEYTLVYEDNEGDRILVGDVPWHMFLSSAKRLRVLKSSELCTLRLSSNQQEKALLDSAALETGR